MVEGAVFSKIYNLATIQPRAILSQQNQNEVILFAKKSSQ